MEQVEITWLRALKVWWSFTWRSTVLFLLAMIPLQIITFFVFFSRLPLDKNKHLDPAQAGNLIGVFFLVWLLMLVLMITLQAQGMRWMLKTAKWSDFRVAVLRPDP